jgi:uncharacterized protein
MLIDVTKLRQNTGKAFPFKLEEQWPPIEFQGETLSFIGAVIMEGTVINTGKIILVDGTASASMQRACGRCLERVTQQVNVPVSGGFIHVAEQSKDITDSVAEELTSYEGSNIDLSSQVREELLLSLPMKGLCREDCKGLCSNCGQNLNVGACGCHTVHIDPRLQVLEKFFKS